MRRSTACTSSAPTGWGPEGNKRYYGLSGVYGPDGTPLRVAGDDECALVERIDIEAVVHRRKVLPFLRDRRTDLYHGLAVGEPAGVPPTQTHRLG